MSEKPTYEELEKRIDKLERADLERRRTEEARRSEQEFIEVALNSQQDTFFLFEPATGRAIRWNRTFNDITGYTDEEIAGMVAPDSYYSPEDLERASVFIEEILETGTGTIELELICKDGHTVATEYKVSVIKNEKGKPKHIISIGRDITDRKQAEDALKESREHFRLLSESSPLGIFQTDKEGRVLYLNNKWLEITGMSMDDALGFGWSKALHPEDRSRVLENWAKCLEEAIGWDGEFRFVRPSGEVRWTHTKTSVAFSPSGKMISHVGINEDITDRKVIEAQLQQAQKMEAIGALAGGVAHDLNNVLSGIVSYPDLLLMQLPEDSPLIEPIRIIQATGKKAAAIVQDLLTLARRGVVVSDVVNLNTIIEEYLTSPEYEKLKSFHPEILVEANLETDLLNTLGSPIHLSQSVMNLISNAAEAMPEGGKLSISTRNQYIYRPINGYDYIEEGDYAVLIISDTGSGISSEDLGRIFEPFYTKKTMGRSGTGLGMAVVWGTVKDHKGYIEVQSAVGEGTTFTIYFPVTRQKQEEDETEISSETCRGSGETILIIDDIKDQREIASSILSELGYSVSTVSSGEEAVEYLRNDSVDLLLLDMIMEPGMDGLDTYKEILQLHPGQKAIIASGFSETDRIKMAQRLGAGKYIRKPYTLEEIAITVKNEIDKR